MKRSSWATSARLHHFYNETKETTLEKVLSDYGLPITVTEVERSTTSTNELIRCESCMNFKDSGEFRIDDDTLRVCKPCLSAQFGSKDNSEKSLADVPIVAAVRLLEEQPESMAILIKHFRKDFEKFLNQEREKALQK